MQKITNKQKNIIIILIVVLFSMISMCYVILKALDKDSGIIAKENIIYEDTISPNEDYVTKEEDKVFYTIKVYQNDNNIKVIASSNSLFTKDISYEIESDNKIAAEDIDIEWQTIMGDTNFTKDNQAVVALICISSEGKVISEKKINFISKAVEVVTDTINKNK